MKLLLPKFSLRFIFFVILIVASWLALSPNVRAYYAVRNISNHDLTVDGNYFGLDVDITDEAASTLEKHGLTANRWLLYALNDPNRFAVAHVMLTKINMPRIPLGSDEWNHLKIDLLPDGSANFHAEQIPELIAFWNQQLKSEDG